MILREMFSMGVERRGASVTMQVPPGPVLVEVDMVTHVVTTLVRRRGTFSARADGLVLSDPHHVVDGDGGLARLILTLSPCGR